MKKTAPAAQAGHNSTQTEAAAKQPQGQSGEAPILTFAQLLQEVADAVYGNAKP